MIKAKRKQSAQDGPEIIVLVPHRILGGDLPASLIEGHAHWLSLSASVLEICPFNSIWETSSKNWKIDCTPGKYCMHKGHELLIDMRSPSWAMVSSLLKPLDASPNLLVSVFPIDSGGNSPSLRLSVVLPRYGLSFYVDEDGDLRSRNIQGMVYDRSQCIGTLFGLVNRLVLRPKITGVLDAVELIPRCVVIPEGDVSFQKLDNHVCVKVNTPHSPLDRVTYQTYRINTDLGCLDTVSLTSKLYCAYLHALTSGCSIDPLTGRSGTEEALSLLWSAGCWSSMKLSPRDAHLMGLIASISPSHTWHSRSAKSMHQVKWRDLPANSQHPELYIVVKAIMAHYERLLPFHANQSDQISQEFPSQERHLLERSARRVSYLFPADSREPSCTTNHCDIQYPGRDLVELDSGEHRAYQAASNVYHRTANARITTNISGMVESWLRTSVSDSKDAPSSLRYDTLWLAPKFYSTWRTTYDLLRKSERGKWFQLLFTLPAMAYASPRLSDLVPGLVAIASEPELFSEDSQRNVQLSPIPTVLYSFDCSKTNPSYTPWTLTAEQLFSRPELCLPEHDTLPGYATDVGNTSISGAISVQRLITTTEARATNPFQHQYVSALRASAKFFESEMSIVSHGAMELPDAETLMGHYARCRATYAESIHCLQQYLGPRSQSERALQQSGQWPRMTPLILLRFLASNSPVTLSGDWNRCLIRLALLVLQVQRARRLLQLHLDNHHEELRRELQNEGCNGWSAEMHPDWLLVQVCCLYCRYDTC